MADRIKHGNVSIAMERITPEQAEMYLMNNGRNRSMGSRNQNKIREAMRNDLWQFTAETIKFDEYGALIDGQHRLDAIRTTGKTQDILVARGLPEDAMLAIDGGMARSNRARAKIHGGVPMNASALILRLINMAGDYKGKDVPPEVLEGIYAAHKHVLNDCLGAYAKAKLFKTGNWVPAIDFAFRRYGLEDLALGWRGLWTEQGDMFGTRTDAMVRFRDTLIAKTEGKKVTITPLRMAVPTVVRSYHRRDGLYTASHSFKLRALSANALLTNTPPDMDDLGRIQGKNLVDVFTRRAINRRGYQRRRKANA